MRDPVESIPTGTTPGLHGHWGAIARQWDRLGAPLRPSAEDLDFFTATVDEWSQQYGAPRVLLLGVTPEIYHLRWPCGTHLLAADHTRSMIDSVWPGPAEQVILADW